jgi:general secretion pathway protein M
MARWSALARREQYAVLAALILVLGALLWWVALAPALSTLRSAPQQLRLLETQLEQMQRLQQQAKTFQAQPVLTLAESRRLLEASAKTLGPNAQLTVVGERVTLTLKGASADAVAQWLTQARLTARVSPTEARLVRNASGTWDGAMVLILSTR